jgi:HEAT repeat protein
MLNPFAEIRPGERRKTYGAFLVLFGIMAGHALLETARDALFLAALPATRLAWVYLSVAAISVLLFALQSRDAGRARRERLATWLLAAAAVNCVFWLLIVRPGTWMLYALYTWSGVLATLLVVRFWTLVGDLFGTVGAAKRLYGPIVAGSVLGAIFGSSVARVMTSSLEPRHLLLAAAAMFALTALGPVLLLPSASLAERRVAQPDLKQPLATIWSRPFLRRIGAIVLLSSVTLTLVDFLFKSSVARNVSPSEYGTFFSSAYLVLNVLSSLAQLFLVGRVMQTSRIHRVHAVLPGLVLAGTLGFVAGGGLIAALVLKGFDGILRHSLHRTATELLYVPLSAELRNRLRGLFDSLGQRGGQVIASVLILVAGALGPAEPLLGVAVLALSVLWTRVAWTLEAHYLGVFRATLGDVATNTRFDFPELDLASLETLMSSLSSSNDDEVIAALDVLASQERTHLVPALILYHPSSPVVIKALELFTAAGREDILGIMQRLLEHSDPEVRAATLRSHAWIAAPNPELYQRCLTDSSPIVRATCLIGLISYTTPDKTANARVALDRLATSGTPQEKLAVARAIRYSPGAGYERILLQLAESTDDRVRLAVARAMRELRNPRFIPKLLEMLPSRALRPEVRATLLSIGAEALDKLEEVLRDPWFDSAIRLHVPRTIMLFEPEHAGALLVRQLDREKDGSVGYRILRALGKLRRQSPHLPLDDAIIRKTLEKTLHNVFELMDWKLQLAEGTRANPARSTPVHALIVSLLEHKELLAMERLFRLVGLLRPEEDVRTLYRGWRDASPTARDSSRELLQHLLETPLRDPVQALVDDVDDSAKLARAGPYYGRTRASYRKLMETLLEKGGVGMRCLVVYHVGEMQMHELRGALEALPSDLAGLVARSVERALHRLTDADDKKVADGA